MYRSCLRPLLFRLDAETAHHIVLASLPLTVPLAPLLDALLPVGDLPTRLGPLVLKNPLGLAAGLDKNGEAISAFAALGFGFIEIGTVTPLPQPGNPRPRLFRLPEDRAIVNRFGFNSEGAVAVARRLESTDRTTDFALGVNVGKNRDTDARDAAKDHRFAIEQLRPFADYLVVNVSSPNTVGLRALQQPRFVKSLVEDAVDAARGVPVFVKVSPDWTGEGDDDDDLARTLRAIVQGGATGIIATNTTLSREHLSRPTLESGGLSGAPLKGRALAVCRRARRVLGPDVPILGVGGIEDDGDVRRRMAAGADAVQLYTALVFDGPLLPRRILRALVSGLSKSPA